VARTIGKLNSLEVGRLREKGMYGDGGGLYLQVSAGKTKSWIFRFKLDGKSREMGLGPVHTIGLADARAKATECRRSLLEGVDPIDARKSRRAAKRLECAKAVTFAECAKLYVKAHSPGWRNERHVAQWTSTIETYLDPVLGDLAVQSVDVRLILKVLEPIWQNKTETASRLRGRIEAILDWAIAHGFRQGDNPARWRGHLQSLLPAPSKIHTVRHLSALPYSEMPAFIQKLHLQQGAVARALEFLILTGARTGEVIGATHDEFANSEKLWIIPGSRMKSGKDHRVPLNARSLDIINEMQGISKTHLFSTGRRGRPLSPMTILALLKRMEWADLTAHGFRSTFRDWAAEVTDHDRDVVEMALAHAIGSKVEAAYRRGDLMEKRRKLMDDWERFCLTPIAGTSDKKT
jgi:integrase